MKFYLLFAIANAIAINSFTQNYASKNINYEDYIKVVNYIKNYENKPKISVNNNEVLINITPLFNNPKDRKKLIKKEKRRLRKLKKKKN